jgi:hypothetical protein
MFFCLKIIDSSSHQNQASVSISDPDSIEKRSRDHNVVG